jgi:hypothetical protein
MINGDKGRLELEVVESAFRLPKNKGGSADGAVHGEKALPNEGHQKIILHPLWEAPQEVPYEIGKGGHGESSSGRVVESSLHMSTKSWYLSRPHCSSMNMSGLERRRP